MTAVKPAHCSIHRTILPVLILAIVTMKPGVVKASARPAEEYPIYMGYEIALGFPHYKLRSDLARIDGMGIGSFDLHTASLLTNIYLLRPAKGRFHTLEPYTLADVTPITQPYTVRLGISFGKIKTLRS